MEKMKKMKTIYCFVGRSNAGKDTLARMMAEEFNIPVICSYTDRPMRITEKQDVQHHFLSQKAMNRLLSTEDCGQVWEWISLLYHIKAI